MAFVMKGGGPRVPWTYFENDSLKKTFRIIPWLSKRVLHIVWALYDSLSDVGEIRVYQRADFQSGSRVLKKVF